MIEFMKETLFDVIHEVDDMLRGHFEEVATSKDRIKLAPMWEEYAMLEKMGRFAVFTARDNGKLVGYGGFFINKHLHHGAAVFAVNDVLYLKPGARKGMNGYRFIKFIHEALAARGDIRKILWHVTPIKDFRPALHRLGYRDEETVVGITL